MPRSLTRLISTTSWPTRFSSDPSDMPSVLFRTWPRCCGLFVFGAENSMRIRRRSLSGSLPASSSLCTSATESRCSAPGFSVTFTNALTASACSTSACCFRNAAVSAATAIGFPQLFAKRKQLTVRSPVMPGGHASGTMTVPAGNFSYFPRRKFSRSATN